MFSLKPFKARQWPPLLLQDLSIPEPRPLMQVRPSFLGPRTVEGNESTCGRPRGPFSHHPASYLAPGWLATVVPLLSYPCDTSHASSVLPSSKVVCRRRRLSPPLSHSPRSCRESTTRPRHCALVSSQREVTTSSTL